MLRSVSWLIAVTLHVGLPALALVAYAWAKPELPAEPHECTICVFPADWFNPLSLVQGATEDEVDGLFGVRSAEHGRRSASFCVRYQYSARLAYAVLFHAGIADSMWLTEDGFVPYRCEGVLLRTVEVPRRPWYPERASRGSSECGCALGAQTCAVE